MAKVNHGGVWKDSTPYAKVNGTWVPVKEEWVKQGGVWTKTWSEPIVPTGPLTLVTSATISTQANWQAYDYGIITAMPTQIKSSTMYWGHIYCYDTNLNLVKTWSDSELQAKAVSDSYNKNPIPMTNNGPTVTVKYVNAKKYWVISNTNAYPYSLATANALPQPTDTYNGANYTFSGTTITKTGGANPWTFNVGTSITSLRVSSSGVYVALSDGTIRRYTEN